MTNITNEDRRAADPERIWLEPVCAAPERCWCEQNNGPCDECGTDWPEYVRADVAAKDVASAYAKGLADGAERERAGVVTWLDDHEFGDDELNWCSVALAERIERGDHLPALSRHADQGEG